MPIYVYRCSHCAHQQDVLQKISDPRLTTCPSCGQEAYEKQVTAAGFRLKGSGWYETDFRGTKPGSHSDGVLGSAASGAAPETSGGAAPAAGGATNTAQRAAAGGSSAPAST